MIDIDSLNSLGKIAASDAAFSSERLQCATRLIGAVLNASYGLTVQWFSSGKQGVHGWAFGSSFNSPARQLVARLLPEGGANSADILNMFMRAPTLCRTPFGALADHRPGSWHGWDMRHVGPISEPPPHTHADPLSQCHKQVSLSSMF